MEEYSTSVDNTAADSSTKFLFLKTQEPLCLSDMSQVMIIGGNFNLKGRKVQSSSFMK